jgi:hypothetical protein
VSVADEERTLRFIQSGFRTTKIDEFSGLSDYLGDSFDVDLFKRKGTKRVATGGVLAGAGTLAAYLASKKLTGPTRVLAMAASIGLGAFGAYKMVTGINEMTGARILEEVDKENSDSKKEATALHSTGIHAAPRPLIAVPAVKNPANPTAINPFGRTSMKITQAKFAGTPSVIVRTSQTEIERFTHQDRRNEEGMGVASLHSDTKHLTATITQQQKQGIVDWGGGTSRGFVHKVYNSTSSMATSRLVPYESMGYQHRPRVHAVNVVSEGLLKGTFLNPSFGTSYIPHVAKITNHISAHKSAGDRKYHDCMVKFIGFAGETLCTIGIQLTWLGSWNAVRKSVNFSTKVWPGTDGRLPDYLFINPGSIPELRDMNVSTTTPSAAMAMVDEAQQRPMGALQTLYGQFRALNPDCISMIAKPADLASFVARSGKITYIKTGWQKIVDFFKKFLNVATTVASICYPVVAAVAPVALEVLNSVVDSTRNAANKVVEAMDDARGFFEGAWKYVDDAFDRWIPDVYQGAKPWELRPAQLPPSCDKLAFLTNTEFEFTGRKIMDWTRGIGGAYPEVPFNLWSVEQLTPPAIKVTKSFAGLGRSPLLLQRGIR